MVGEILFLCFLTTAIAIEPPHGPFDQEDSYRQDYSIETREEPVYAPGSRALRENHEYYKLPKELFEKWFKNVENQTNESKDKLADEDTTDVVETTEVNKVNNATEAAEVVVTEETNVENEKPTNLDYDDNDNVKDYSPSGPYNEKKMNMDANADVNKELTVKQKLLELISGTKRSIDSKVAPLKDVHNAYKTHRLYKIGYLVSSINRTQDSVADFYKHVEDNMQSWDVLKILYAYEQVKSASEFLTKALHTLSVVASNRQTDHNMRTLDYPLPHGLAPQGPKPLQAPIKNRQKLSFNVPKNYMSGLSWAYYNDED